MHTNYVISLATAEQRRKHIKTEFNHQNISFEFFNAFYPSEALSQVIDQYLPNLAHTSLSEVEKACFMSHFMLWQKCIHDNLPYIYIFEDDILLGENAYSFLSKDNWLEERFSQRDKFILRFETFLNYSKCRNVNIPPFHERQILKLIVENCGAGAYVLSKEAAKSLCNLITQLPTEKLLAIDLLMFNTFLNKENIFSYQLSPALCIQERLIYKESSKLSSQLEESRQILHNNKKKKRRTLIQLLKSIINKPKKLWRKYYKNRHIIIFK